MKIPLDQCRRNLAIVWFLGGGILFALLVVQTLGNHYGEEDREAWGWLLPNIMPTLSLIIGALVAEAVSSNSTEKLADDFLYRMSLALSIIYLLLVLLPVVAQPFTSSSPMDALKRSNLWLGPLQGLVSASLGAFFIKAKT
jgi:Na+/H+-dicarboxylate symporter